MENQSEQVNRKQDTSKNIVRRLLQVSMTILITAAALFVLSGKIDWIYAWVYIIASISVIIVNAFILKPDLISERGRKKENVEKWDKIITVFISIVWLALYVIPGLDKRFGWSGEMPLWIHIAGLIIFISGNAFVTWSMVSNTYFSTAVRIQYDRDHSVANSGPYGYIRHPGYLGIILYNISTPLILGSMWAFLPAGILSLLFILRTVMEDSTLKTKLEGYRQYADEVKFRLIPFVW